MEAYATNHLKIIIMESRKDLSTDTKNVDEQKIDNEQKEAIHQGALGEAALNRNEVRDPMDTDDASNSYEVHDDYNTALRDAESANQNNIFTASTRFGDEITDIDSRVFSGRDTDAGNIAPLASAKFGEELISRENDVYPDGTKPFATDDLTDDNDFLTERHDTSAGKNDDGKNLWDKLKDKAENIGEEIKKAFD